MVTAITTVPTALITPPPRLAFTHIITLLNRQTGDERTLEIHTMSDKFTVVMQEICWQRAQLGLKGYEVWEILPCEPF